MKLRYTPAAILDLQEIRDYIGSTLQNPEATLGILRDIASACARLKAQPRMGMELRRKLNREIEGRCIVVGKCLVIYDIDEAVSILRVLDTRTDYLKVLFP